MRNIKKNRGKFSRREANNLFLFTRNVSDTIKSKYKLNKNNLFLKNKNSSDYNSQLREKQKVKRIYGITEKQFYRYFKLSYSSNINIGKNLLILLESRLDNIVFRMGYGNTRAQSRQLVLHRFIMVNNKVVNIPSYNVNINDIISINPFKKNKKNIKNLKINNVLPKWIYVDTENFIGIYKSTPLYSQISKNINTKLIIEWYSR